MTLLTLFFLALVIVIIVLFGAKILKIGIKILFWVIIVMIILAAISWFV